MFARPQPQRLLRFAGLLLCAGLLGLAGVPGHAQTVTATVPVGMGPQAFALNRTANAGANGVAITDGATNAVTTVPVGSAPLTRAVNSVTNKIYVANSGDNTVTVIDGVTNLGTVTGVGTAPTSVAVNPLNNQIYVANANSNSVTASAISRTVNSCLLLTGVPIVCHKCVKRWLLFVQRKSSCHAKKFKQQEIGTAGLGFVVASRLLSARQSFPHLYQDFIEGDPDDVDDRCRLVLKGTLLRLTSSVNPTGLRNCLVSTVSSFFLNLEDEARE